MLINQKMPRLRRYMLAISLALCSHVVKGFSSIPFFSASSSAAAAASRIRQHYSSPTSSSSSTSRLYSINRDTDSLPGIYISPLPLPFPLTPHLLLHTAGKSWQMLEVRQATKKDFPAIAEGRPAVIFVPEKGGSGFFGAETGKLGLVRR